MAEDKPHYHGHRSRLRTRFLKDFGASLPDYELVEMLLFGAHPRGDVKPLAKALLARFKNSLAELLAADPVDIRKVKGASDATVAALKSVHLAAVRAAREPVAGRTVISSWQQLLEYCRTAMAREPREQFRVLFLDRKNALMADEVQSTGTVDQAPVYPREVVKRALELGATAIIMVQSDEHMICTCAIERERYHEAAARQPSQCLQLRPLEFPAAGRWRQSPATA